MEKIKLENIADIIMGQSPDGNSYNTLGDGTIFYQGNADFGLINPIPRFYTNRPTKLAKNGDILISVRAPVGALNIANSDCCIGRGLAAIRAINDNESKFIYYGLLNSNRILQQNSTGSTFNSINKNVLNTLGIPLYTKQTQQKIVEELDCLSDIIEKKKQQLVDLDNLIKSQFIEMFDLYNKENNFLDVLIDDTKNGFKFDSNHYKSNGEIPIIDQGEEFICGFKNKEPDKQPYKYESIVFGDHTERFKYLNFDYYLGADGAKILRCKNGYNTTFVYWFMKIFYIPVGGYSRHFKFLKELLFSKPPIELQNQFAGFVENIEKSKNDIKQSIEETQNLFNERMQHYFGE